MPSNKLDAIQKASPYYDPGGGRSDYARLSWYRYQFDKWVRPARWISVGLVLGGGLVMSYNKLSERHLRSKNLFLKRGEKYYQVLGHAWDQETKDFTIVSRPLFHCKAQLDSHEAFLMMTSKSQFFESVSSYDELPANAQDLALCGPFQYDPEWKYNTVPTSLKNSTPAVITPAKSNISCSGFATSSHELYRKNKK
eukprot:TRINITY_DN19720_c0_g1_i1.p1 TRINITY_DN19720_c0_g1~~TRINITY_DN19720_c0_g1_i1.p1  ORF type:complete len:212 (+),score=18.93 TRINITY_DN19720_c0_g1_i1:51-638(+)